MSDADLEKIPHGTHRSNSKETQVITRAQREIDGFYFGTNFIQQKVKADESSFTRDDLLELHKIVMNDPLNPQNIGVLRSVGVKVTTKINGDFLEGPSLPPDPTFLSEYFNEFAGEFEEKTMSLVDSPLSEVLSLATWAHRRFVDIHPFVDGNGRVARLLVDYIFRKSRLPYMRDWGASADEYKIVVYNSFKNNNWRDFTSFLAKKLNRRLGEIGNRFNDDKAFGDFKSHILSRKKEVEDFLG